MVKLDVVDLVGCLCLESLVDKIILSISYPKLLIIKDATESSIGNEAAIALIFILEEGFDQQSSVFYVNSDSGHTLVQFILFSLSKLILWIENRWSLIPTQGLQWILLKILLSEDALNHLVEVEVSDLGWVRFIPEVVLKKLILLCSQLKLLSIKSSSEFGGVNNSLPEWIMVLEELTNSNSVSFHLVSDLGHESLDGGGA